ncbi:tuberin-like isoform X2 [Gigantopelta aegis]|uniref:tuberin-like isoform X2 n=1 Tax=Gigantopelta aegis TaxID=1735272 RepID=UPI001B889A2B|nr:tuberin-like isoform X2 [Gigantopelta aegis]
MSGKEPDNFKEKIRKLLGINKPSTPLTIPRTQTKEIIFTPELLKEIGPDGPLNNRIKTIRELSEIVRTKRLEENAMEALWAAICDLLPPHVPAENRHVALHFLRSLLEGQLNNLGILRGHFFRVIQKLTCPEDLQDKLEMFKILSEDGRNLLDFEEETGLFLCNWMPDVIAAGQIQEFLHLLVQVIKFNAAYLDEDVVASLVQQTCMIPNEAKSQEERNLKHCLEVLDAVVSYSYLPSSSLHPFIAALCHMVNKPKFCEESWELMRKLLGTHLGHSSIYTMCCMLQDRCPLVNPLLLRGAVFFIGMALWGSRLVTSLKHTPASVLPSFLQALSTQNEIVAYEVVLSIQRLVKKYGKDVHHVTWEIILDIVETLLKQLELQPSREPRMQGEVHDVLTTVEELHERGHFMGSVARFFNLIEICVNNRSEKSVSMLIDYHAQSIHPGKENWIQNLSAILDKYFRQETRTEIRKKSLNVLSFILSINKHVYESDLMEKVVIPQLGHIENDPDPEVRRVAVEMLLVLANDCNTAEFMDIIVLVEKLLRRPMTGEAAAVHTADGADVVCRTDESQIVDIRTAVVKLVEVFKCKLYQVPSSHCLKVYELLIDHMVTHYSQKYVSHSACTVRKAVIEALLQLRSDSLHRLGLIDRGSDAHFAYTRYIVCKESEEKDDEVPASPTTSSTSCPWYQAPSVISYNEAFKLFIMCLEHEFDWDVLKCVLEKLPLVLQNKTLILSAEHCLVDILCHRLCSMVNDRCLGFPEKLQSLPPKFTRSDFHTYIFPVLAAMVTYHDYLDRNRQRELIKCLEFGLVSKCAKVCVSALRISSLEMQDVMMRQLPSVLLSLSKISATISMAIPVLAFLSSIVRLQNLYVNFVEDQYMSVFAIALPYTNPFKFSHYTVSLAHHVIAIWFIRCRLPFRKAFVKFIQKSLKANVLQQFEENSMLHLQNQDSRDRSRSGSYTEGAQSRFRRSTGASMLQRDRRPVMDEKMSQFHKELTETCTDVMARYTFGNFAAMPHRSHLVQFLLSGGQSQTWLHGNRIITITTSGGGTKVGNTGLCEKCLVLYQESYESKPPPPARHDRRRHKSAACVSMSHTQLSPSVVSSDENFGRPRWSRDDMSLPSEDLFGLGQDEVGVQTGSSLSGSWLENESLESLLLGIKSQSQDKRVFCTNQCNCWCTSWAEIHIRGPSGNISWMMRIENEVGHFSSQHDVTLPDLTLLFAPLRQKPVADVVDSSAKIDSESLGEAEYESLYSQHFPEDTVEDPSVLLKQEKPSQLPKPGLEGSAVLPDLSHPCPVTLRKSNSSPSLLTSCSDSPSPKEVLSDVAVSQMSSSGSSVQKSCDNADSDTTAREVRSVLTRKRSNSFHDPEKDKLPPKMAPVITKEEMLSSVVRIDDKGKKALTDGNMECGNSSKTDVGTSVIKQMDSSTDKDNCNRCEAELERTQKSDNFGEVFETAEVVSPSAGVVSPSAGVVSHALEVVPEATGTESLKVETETGFEATPDSSDGSWLQDEVPELPAVKKRGHTISVMSPAQVAQQQAADAKNKRSLGKDQQGGINPSFVFLQLFHSHSHLLGHDQPPMLLPQTETINRAVKMLDHIHPYETHKIGVIYVGHGQTSDEKAILSNMYGSERYVSFIQRLGDLISLKDVNQNRVFLGGLELGADGQFTYSWQDESMQVIFHVATLMPNRESDPNCNAKKLHIGNDFVTIVYNDSGEDYTIGTIKGQFNYVNIVIRPLDYETNAVTLQTKEDIAEILGHTDTKIISDANLALLVRQIAMHCNLASLVLQRQQVQPQDPFASNWLERLRQIKRIHQKVQQEESSVHGKTSSPKSRLHTRSFMEDFTDYV